MPGPIIISYTNWSKTLLEQSCSYTGLVGEVGIGSLAQMPTDNLAPGGGMTSMEMDENVISNIAGGVAWISLGWKNKADDYHFGVKIYMPIQVAHMGDRPYYQVASGMGSGPAWTTPVDDPAYPYTIDPKVDFRIDITPYSTHTSLSLNVTINDLV